MALALYSHVYLNGGICVPQCYALFGMQKFDWALAITIVGGSELGVYLGEGTCLGYYHI